MAPAARKGVNMPMVSKNYDATIFNNMDTVQTRIAIVYINSWIKNYRNWRKRRILKKTKRIYIRLIYVRTGRSMVPVIVKIIVYMHMGNNS